MDNTGINTNPNSEPKAQGSIPNINILPSESPSTAVQPRNLIPGRKTSTIHLDIDHSQKTRYRNILPKPRKNSESGMEVGHAEEQPTEIATNEPTRARTRSRRKNAKSTSYNEREAIEIDEDSESENNDFEDTDSRGDPGSSTLPTSLFKARKAYTTFTKTELIALGVAYAVVPSWPLAAEYFPHRTRRSLYQTFKHTFVHAGNDHELARDSFPPGADIPELREKFQTLRRLGSRTRRVLEEDLPQEHDEDIIRGHLSLSRWQKGNEKRTANEKRATDAEDISGRRSLPVREAHMQALQEEWEDEDDESDFEDVGTAGTATAIKTEQDQLNATPLSVVPKSLVIDLDAPPHISEPTSDLDIRDSSEPIEPQFESSLERIKSSLIEQISQCGNAAELCRALMDGLDIADAEIKPDEPQKKGRPGRPRKRKRGSN
ncbi:hypothetical protein OCU04_003174 [Sclerotinia nivalis]|uniref:Myb-like domain-containing protein n=1 Tax=Sclerotinia nivalis TaxID=352851 RepID=A0A9X0AYJ4_9HELO|nr:hypothetical protein OCU04_003174 [Sclerotinia nivalis]